MASSKNKTPPTQSRKRNEVSYENGRRVVVVPVVAQPIRVPVPTTVVPVQVQNVTVTVRVPKDYIAYHPYHHPLNTLGVVCEGFHCLRHRNALIRYTK